VRSISACSATAWSKAEPVDDSVLRDGGATSSGPTALHPAPHASQDDGDMTERTATRLPASVGPLEAGRRLTPRTHESGRPSVKRRVRGVAITRAPRPGPRQAHLEGFDLHGNVAVAADNREALEQLCRYVLRPPIAQECLSRTADRSQASHRHSEGVSIHRHTASEEVAADSEKPRKSSRYGATGGVVDALRTISGRIPLYGSYLLSVSLVVDTLADGGLPHNRHKPRLAGYELGGSE